MAYLALYRRWRPASLEDLKGQSHVRRAIKRAIQSEKIGHAYLFSGPRGTGKTSTAKILAKALNCLNPKDGEPCGECESCKKIDNNASMDVFEIDAASNRGIDEIRDLRETVKFAPVEGKYKVYIIDEVHMLTTEAFNALLKTLEEPPKFVIFILATTEAHKVPTTIQSRCQRFDFRRISVEDIEERLLYVAKEMNFNVEEEAVSLIATYADGGLRDALSLLDQCAAISGGDVKKSDVEDVLGLVGNDWTSELAIAIGEQNTKKVIDMIDEITKKAKELTQIINELSLCLRTVMIYTAAGSLDSRIALYKVSEENLEKLKNLYSKEKIIFALKKLNEAAYALKWTNAPRITVEVALLSICCGEAAASEAAPLANVDNARISRLENMVRELALKLQKAKDVKTDVSAIKTNFETSPKTEQAVTTEKPEAKKPQSPPPAPKEIEEPLTKEPSKDGATLWEKVLNHFEQTGSKSVLICLKQGTCTKITDKSIVLSFPNEMLSSIAVKMYKNLIEDALQSFSGKNLTLITESAKKSNTAPPAATMKKDALKTTATQTNDLQKAEIKGNKEVEQKKEPYLGDLGEREKANLKTATDIFGDNFVSISDINKIKIAESGNLPKTSKFQDIPVADEYDFAEEPDFSDIPPPDMDFM